MTGGRFEPTPWWEFGQDEKPVPLGPDATWQAADEAELIVNAEREAIGREDTEPNLVTLAQLAAAAQPPQKWRGIEVRKSAAAVAVVALIIGCGAMFALGWSQGKEAVVKALGRSDVSESTSGEQLGDSLMSSSQINKNDLKGGEG